MHESKPCPVKEARSGKHHDLQFADASNYKATQAAGSDLTGLNSLFRQVSCSLYVQTLYIHAIEESVQKCSGRTETEKVRELRSLFDLSSSCYVLDRNDSTVITVVLE